LAAASYGAADFFGGLATRRSSMLAVAVLSQGAGFVLISIALPFFHGEPSRAAIVYGACAGICGGAGIALLYHSLSIGKMGVVSPITAVLAASVPVVVGVARGEHLTIWQSTGIGVALIAVVMISLTTEPDGRFEFSTAGVREAIASGFVLGGFYTFFAKAGSGSGMYPLVSARFASTAFLLILAIAFRKRFIPSRPTVPVVVIAGTLDMLANYLYMLATYAGYLSIAAVLTSLYPGSTVFLARFVLRERLSPVQKIGVGFALIGVVLIAL
jgi:drug/metabolite transporter (DMT)-like permease